MSFQDELDQMNTETQSVFGVTVSVRREVKGALNIETGASTTVSSETISVPAIRSEVRKPEYSPGGGRSQHITEVVYEILTADVRGESPALSPGTPDEPPGPIRKGDLIIESSRLIYGNGDPDGQPQEFIVRSVELSIDQRFYRVTATSSEKA